MDTPAKYRTSVRFSAEGKHIIDALAERIGVSTNRAARCAIAVYAAALDRYSQGDYFVVRVPIPRAFPDTSLECLSPAPDEADEQLEYTERLLQLPLPTGGADEPTPKGVMVQFNLPVDERLRVDSLVEILRGLSSDETIVEEIPHSVVIRAAWSFLKLLVDITMTDHHDVCVTNLSGADCLFADEDSLREIFLASDHRNDASRTVLRYQIPGFQPPELMRRRRAAKKPVASAPAADVQDAGPTAVPETNPDKMLELVRSLNQERENLELGKGDRQKFIARVTNISKLYLFAVHERGSEDYEKFDTSGTTIPFAGDDLVYVLSNPLCFLPGPGVICVDSTGNGPVRVQRFPYLMKEAALKDEKLRGLVKLSPLNAMLDLLTC